MCTLECYECRPGCGAKFFNAFESLAQGGKFISGRKTERRDVVLEKRRSALNVNAGHQTGSGGMPPVIEASRSVLFNGFETDESNSNQYLADMQEAVTKLKKELGAE
jgi:hypothetical protein